VRLELLTQIIFILDFSAVCSFYKLEFRRFNDWRAQNTALSHTRDVFHTDKPPPYPIPGADLVSKLAAVWASFSLCHGHVYVVSPQTCYVSTLLPRDRLLGNTRGCIREPGARVLCAGLPCSDADTPTASPGTLARQGQKVESRGSSDGHRQFDIYM